MALEILDRAGIVGSDPEDRGIDVNWPTPLPESDMDRLQEAQVKAALGVPRAVILTELGYGELAMEKGSDTSATKVRPRTPGAADTCHGNEHGGLRPGGSMAAAAGPEKTLTIRSVSSVRGAAPPAPPPPTRPRFS